MDAGNKQVGQYTYLSLGAFPLSLRGLRYIEGKRGEVGVGEQALCKS